MALRGIKVVEMAGLAPAPFAGMILSDMGAKVIRIDRINATPTDNVSRGKRSIALNLKENKGVKIVEKLCKKADVLIEPFRPGVMEKLGLGPEKLLSENPRLIYTRLTGFGQSGILSQKAGHDINYIAMSGVLSKLGRRNECPNPPINLLADFAGGGVICALGVIAALFERSSSGKGQTIDANMVEGSAYIASWLDAMKDMLLTKERGNNLLDGGAAFYNTYETKDGKYMSVGAIEPKFYNELIKGLGLEDKGVSQSDDQEKQFELFAKIFLTKTRDEWTKIFENLDACVMPVLTSEEASVHPHNKSLFIHSKNPRLQAAPAPRFSRTPSISEARPLPGIGEHTFQILQDYGFSESDCKSLLEQGVISQKSKL